MVMNPPGQVPPKSGGYGSPKNAPGAKINLDGTISLNKDSVRRDIFAKGDEAKASAGKRNGLHNRSASWSVNSMDGNSDNAPEMFEALSPVKESPMANGSASIGAPRRMFSDHDSPQSLSVPLLVVLLYWHNIFRRYILNQIDITTHMVPRWLARIGLHPTESRGPVRFFYCAAGYIGSRNFHSMALPLLVWTYDCGFTRLVMVFYCMTSGVGCLLKGALATNTSSSRPANSSSARSCPTACTRGHPSPAATPPRCPSSSSDGGTATCGSGTWRSPRLSLANTPPRLRTCLQSRLPAWATGTPPRTCRVAWSSARSC